MAMRRAMQRGCCEGNGVVEFLRRFNHSLAIPPSCNTSIDPISSLPLSFPESDTGLSTQFPGFAPGEGSMDLMAVPKRKISHHKRGIRNGPKALKPTPVIVRCMNCGRVKLPHFYCCSGRKEEPGERSDATN